MVTDGQLVVAVIAVGAWCTFWVTTGFLLALHNRKHP